MALLGPLFARGIWGGVKARTLSWTHASDFENNCYHSVLMNCLNWHTESSIIETHGSCSSSPAPAKQEKKKRGKWSLCLPLCSMLAIKLARQVFCLLNCFSKTVLHENSTHNNGLQGAAFSGLSPLRVYFLSHSLGHELFQVWKQYLKEEPTIPPLHHAEMKQTWSKSNESQSKRCKTAAWAVSETPAPCSRQRRPQTEAAFSVSPAAVRNKGSYTSTSDQSLLDNRLLGNKTGSEKKSRGRRGCGMTMYTSRGCWLVILLRQDDHGRASELHHNRLHSNSLSLERNRREARAQAGQALRGRLTSGPSPEATGWGRVLGPASGPCLLESYQAAEQSH